VCVLRGPGVFRQFETPKAGTSQNRNPTEHCQARQCSSGFCLRRNIQFETV